ncbi:PREDICTED: proline-, glutamic acid- and leucine-rich protein 1-like isoform X2 [Papilio polytes]|uniref:proline-, glutamic acid- and leucine-rich protein 1-like isoform X2 n=1 Tax=Papilio polytes TaxID=76194 RepID=UPI0006764104|nr:PREDICTED: proline-, glutamic acid- and leucine-rich protein 1-like isoform X2 [Papilio polytes]
MSEIFKKVSEVDPNNSDAVKEVLTSFFQNIVKHTEVNCYQWLRALEDVLSRFPRYCSTHKSTIETHLTHFLSSNNNYDVIQAAKCAQTLQQVPWPQEKSATAKSAWRDQMTLLCDAAHSLIDALFIDSVELYQRSSKKDMQKNSNSPLTLALSKINSTANSGATNRQVLLHTRLRNVFIFIQAMIVEIYPVPKPIQPQTILNVIVRSLSVTSAKKSQVTDVGPLKIQALRTLDALIACLGANLIPYSPLVFRIVMQTFRWTSDNQTESSREVRSHTYRSAGGWLSALGLRPAGLAHEHELATLVIQDITPLQKTVQLTMSGGQPLKNLSKKARRKLQNQMLKDSSISSHIPGEKNKVVEFEDVKNDIAMASLGFAEIFLSVCGVFMKPTTHKLFQEHLVRQCFNANLYSDEYVLALLRTLEVCRKTTPSSVPPPTQYCLQLYSTLSNNQCIEISRFCSQALLDIRMHLHCSPPTINFALEVPKETHIQKSMVVSERNREALKKLLGDRLSDEENIEVITIRDEPTKKRPRLDQDNISLSSESICSVEITDSSKDGTEELEIERNEEEITEDATTNDEDMDVQNTTEVTANEIESQVIDSEKLSENVDETVNENNSIYEAKTQIDTNVSNDEDDNQTLSMEVAYDLPTAVDKVRVLDQVDDDNLPSTNDTDDVQITCGQVALTSQDNEINITKEVDEIALVVDKEETIITNESNDNVEKIKDTITSNCEVTNEAEINPEVTKDVTVTTDETLTNGAEKPNGNINEMLTQIPDNLTDKLSKPDGISVEDMMADFVDEVNDQTAEA